MTPTFPHKSIYLLSSALLLVLSRSVNAAGTISIDVATITTNDDLQRVATATVTLDNNDLFNAADITFTGVDSAGTDSGVFTKTVSTKQTTDSGATHVIWNGAITASNHTGFASFAQGADGTITGSFTTNESIHEVVTTPGGTVQVRSTFWMDVPDTDALVGPEDELNQSSAGGGAAEVVVEIGAEDSFTPDNSGTIESSNGESISVMGPTGWNLRRRELQAAPLIDVLVLVTNRAMCDYAGQPYGCNLAANKGSIESKIPLLQNEMNTAMRYVGINASIRIVKVIHLGSSYDGRPAESTLKQIRNTAEIKQWRTDSNADLVAMLTGSDPGGRIGGIAYLNSFESAISVSALAGYAFARKFPLSSDKVIWFQIYLASRSSILIVVVSSFVPWDNRRARP
jgi:hypothetical protein